MNYQDAIDTPRLAAMTVANIMDVIDRLANDPYEPGDRGPAADRARADRLANALRRFRETQADVDRAFDEAHAA